ncbi:MAG TPA: hypothetical protein VMT85_02760 [Thermoanaerobaculia bacterium]|nr:hypothetical protein [Thermoanaerobaculia bacterium]
MRAHPIAIAVAAAMICGFAAAGGGNAGANLDEPTQNEVMQIISNWEKTPRFAANMVMQKYGPPAEATATRLVWFDNGPWKRTVITNEPTDHDFPMPHQDVMEQSVNYAVPPEKLDELAAYDGSVHVHRTRGEMSARCDLEPANFIALNLAHDVITGKRSVDEARQQYADLVIAKMTTQEPVPYAEGLTFDPAQGAGFADRTIIGQEMLQKIEQKKQEMMAKALDGAGRRE